MKFLDNFLFFLSIAVILSLCYFSCFNTFQTDDYGLAGRTNEIGFLPAAKELYMNWGGRYFSYSLNALNPAGNLSAFWLTKVFPIFLWANLILGFYLNFKRYFHLNFAEALKRSFIAFLFYTVLLANISEHYFWISGAMVYFLPHIFALYFIYIVGIRAPKLHHQLLKFLLIILIMGTNEIVALFLLLFLVFQLYNNYSKKSIAAFSIGLLFFCILFFAPGNFMRMGSRENNLAVGFLMKIGIAAANGGYIFLKIIFIIPLFIAVFQEEILKINRKFSLRFRWNLQIILLCFLAFSGLVIIVKERSLETLLIYALLTISTLVVQYLPKIKKIWIVSLVAIFIPSIILFPYQHIYFNVNYNLSNILKELFYNNLKEFENEIYGRHETLRNSQEDKVVLKTIKNIPRILYFDELGSAKHRNYVNQQLELFYHKKSVVRE